MLQRLDNQSHTFHQAPTAIFYSFPTLVSESPLESTSLQERS
jgi:hypothetical protein